MKAVRPLLIGLGAVLVLLLLALAVAFNSSVQTWAARRALAAQPGWSGSIGSVSAGLDQVRLTDVKIAKEGAVLTLPALETDLSLWSAARERVLITRLVAKGWTLDLTDAVPPVSAKSAGTHARRMKPSRATEFSLLPTAYADDPSAAAVQTAFQGLFKQLQLPVDLSLDGVELEGEVILPAAAAHGPMRARLQLKGGGLAAGREGTFSLDVAGTKADGGALTLHARVTTAMDAPRSFSRIGAKADAAVSGAKLPEGVKLNVDAQAVRTGAGETYSLLLARGEKQLATVNAELVLAASRITGMWRLDLHDDDLAPFSFGRALPTFAAAGEGSLETDTTFHALHASGRLTASANRLEAVRPELSAIGPIDLMADFDVLQHGNSLRVDRLVANVSGSAPLAGIRALQPFEFNLSTAELRVADPAADLLGVTLTGLPVEWARPFLGELQLSGGGLSGELAGSARDGGLSVRTRRPLTLGGLSLSQPDQPLLQAVDVSLNASADYTPRGWQAQIVELTLRREGKLLLSLDAKAGQLAGAAEPLKATGRWSADLPGWLMQPVAAGKLVLASGSAQGDFNASIDGTKAIETNVALTNLVAANKEPLPAITAQMRGDIAPDGKVTFKLPLLLERAGRKSDLQLTGTYIPTPAAAVIDAQLTGELVHLRDAQLLAVVLPGGTEGKPAPGGKPAEDSPGPPWAGVGGKITLALKKVVYGESFEVTDVNGAIRIDPQSLQLDAVHAKFGPESDVKVGGGVVFKAAAAQPYAVASDVVLRNFDAGAAFRAVDPAKLPTVEGKVSVSGKMSGSGATLSEAIGAAHGDLQVTGKSGVFRALSADLTERVQKTQTTVETIGGILGAVTGSEKYTDIANKSQILTEISDALAEIPFDQMVATAVRDEKLNIVLKDFTVISPEVRLTGGGEVRHVEGVAILAQPLSLQLNLGARGRFAALLKRAGLLDRTQDSLGYTSFLQPIKVGGTLAATDTTELRNALLNSALERSGLLDGILGK